MKVTHVSLAPTTAATDAGRPALTPELLAATGARYSRNNEGLDAIVANIDFNKPDKSVDSIFKMVDYGHQSIADMVPVAMFMDGLSVLLAYFLWAECHVVAGQESSSRYIKMNLDGLISPDVLGVPEKNRTAWLGAMEGAYAQYDKAVAYWTKLSQDDPAVMRIPDEVIQDKSDKGVAKLERMRRNYVFDRSRYFIPVAAATNVMMVMSAREWSRLINVLLSHYHPEFRSLGEHLLSELSLVAPRMVRHARASEDTRLVLLDDFALDVGDCAHEPLFNTGKPIELEDGSVSSANPVPLFDSHDYVYRSDALRDLRHRVNRYSRFGEGARNTVVTFSWAAVSMGEIRDFNRHRTGEKWCPLVPVGFYCAHDQAPPGDMACHEEFGLGLAAESLKILSEEEPSYIYHTLLGHQYVFSHTTTFNHFVYECELRTGVGAHYRYAKHLHDLLKCVYEWPQYAQLSGVIFEGSAEPE